jgi:hypothetical protein
MGHRDTEHTERFGNRSIDRFVRRSELRAEIAPFDLALGKDGVAAKGLSGRGGYFMVNIPFGYHLSRHSLSSILGIDDERLTLK